MTKTNSKHIIAIACGLAISMSGQVQAIEFSEGEITGSFDTTISYGASWRIEDRDPNNVAKAVHNPFISFADNEGERAALGRFSANSDDGNLNYDDGDLISHAIKATSELDIQYRNMGAFVRATYFYDFENNDNPKLTEIARTKFVGERFRLLDAYVYGNFEIAGHFGTLRVGRQVVSWGESTFIQGGINVVNPVDVSKLRIAGAELKEAFLPIEQVWGSIDLSETVSIEGLYMFEFEQIDPDPSGTYFSTNDFGTPGGEYAMFGFGTLPDDPISRALATQLGITAVPLADGGFVPVGGFPRSADNFPSESGQYGLTLRWYAEQLHETEFGFHYLNYHSRLPLISGNAVTSTDISTGSYFIEYPEDIKMYGFSFNTTVFGTWALQGEYSYRNNQPLQFDDVEVLFAGLTPLNALIPQPVNRLLSQLGEFAPGERIQGWARHEVGQLQFTLTKLFGPGNPFGANEWVVLGEFGVTKVFDLPEKSVLRYNGPGTDTGGGPDFLTGNFRNPITETDGFADDISWGYRLVSRIDYNSAFGSAYTISPRLGFTHDVKGTTPGPGGNFVEDRKSLTIGVGLNYLQKWIIDVSYTSFFGAGRYNELRDRDFLSASIRYSF